MCEITDCEMLSQGSGNIECEEKDVLDNDWPRCQDTHAAIDMIRVCIVSFLDPSPCDVDIEKYEKNAEAKDRRVKSVT